MPNNRVTFPFLALIVIILTGILVTLALIDAAPSDQQVKVECIDAEGGSVWITSDPSGGNPAITSATFPCPDLEASRTEQGKP